VLLVRLAEGLPPVHDPTVRHRAEARALVPLVSPPVWACTAVTAGSSCASRAVQCARPARSCTSSLRLIRQPDRPGTIPSLLHLYEGFCHSLPSLFLPVGAHRFGVAVYQVVYPLAADNVLSPLPRPLIGGNQPVMRTRNRFSRPRPALLACNGTHLRRSTLRCSTPAGSSTVCGWGHGGTRKRHTSRSDHPWSVKPAALAGVQGRHTLAEPVPWVGIGLASVWRKLTCGHTKLWYTWNSTRCWPSPSSPLHEVALRRRIAATRWRRLRLSPPVLNLLYLLF
jgi:hypothetical protein